VTVPRLGSAVETTSRNLISVKIQAERNSLEQYCDDNPDAASVDCTRNRSRLVVIRINRTELATRIPAQIAGTFACFYYQGINCQP